jgi:hypothetical protein
MIRIAVVMALAGCAGNGSGPATGSGSSVAATPTCDGIRAKVQQLYRAEAEKREPKRVDEAVADNTAMVDKDCAKAPDKVAPCVVKATTIAEIEKSCLIPLDEEGTEGDKR